MKSRTSESVRVWRLLTVAALVALMAPAAAPGLELIPYAFADRFPGSVQHLGFQKGTLDNPGPRVQRVVKSSHRNRQHENERRAEGRLNRCALEGCRGSGLLPGPSGGGRRP